MLHGKKRIENHDENVTLFDGMKLWGFLKCEFEIRYQYKFFQNYIILNYK